MDSENPKKKPESSPTYSLNHHLWVGAGLGFYFGFIYRPLRDEVDFVYAASWSILIMIVMVAVKFIPRSRPAISTLVPFALRTLITYAIILVLLETRLPIYEFGGRIAVVPMMTVLGLIGGWLYSKRGNML